jgi:hypothetical protein
MMTVFVNERAVQLPEGSPARRAVEQHDPTVAARLDAGTAYLTDGRGIRLDPDAPLPPGGIVRVVVSARRHHEETRAHS